MANRKVIATENRGNELDNWLTPEEGTVKGYSLHPQSREAAAMSEYTQAQIEMVDLDMIEPDPQQPRRSVDDPEIEELAESFRQHGILRPLLLLPIPTWDQGKPQVHRIVYGERTWRAAKRAGLRQVPAIIRSMDAGKVLEIQMTENIQRRDLSEQEVAYGARRLMKEFNLSLREVARRIGKSPALLSKIIRVSDDPALMRAIKDGGITYAEAQEMIVLENRERMKLVEQVQEQRAQGEPVTQKSVRDQVRTVQLGQGVSSRNTSVPSQAGIPVYTPQQVPAATLPQTQPHQSLSHAKHYLEKAESDIKVLHNPQRYYHQQCAPVVQRLRELLDSIERIGAGEQQDEHGEAQEARSA